jgi:hypothetical protein
MHSTAVTTELERVPGAAIALCAFVFAATAPEPVLAASCSFEPQGEGRVAAVIDARTFRLEDGREIRLAGIETIMSGRAATNAAPALSAIVAGRDVTLTGEDDTPDRYGRQPAFAFLDGSDTPVQGVLLAQGEALVSGNVTGKDCGQTRHLGRPGGHKKRGKSGRYFGRDRALCGGGRQGSVGAAGRGDDLPEFRAELDTGLCCDYFKAHDRGHRSLWNEP